MKDIFFEDDIQKEAYLKESARLRIQNGKRGIFLLIGLNHICHTLDYFVYPDIFNTFFIIRVVWSFVLILLFILLSKKDWGIRYYNIIGYMWTLLISLPLCLMIFLKEGSLSPYYAGLNLAIFGACQVLSYNQFEAMRHGLTVASFYTIAVVAHKETPFDLSVFYNNLIFIMLTVIINVYVCYFFTEIRIKEFKHRYKLEEMDRLKTEFYANVNHELRTPLTMTISPIERILNHESNLPENVNKLLSLARNNGLRLLSLINDLLEVLRLDESKKQIKLIPVDIALVVSGIVNSVKYIFAEQRQQISLINNCRDSVISGDTSSLEKIFLNLLSNAAKFTPNDGIITVSMDSDANNVTIKICDTGVGIDEEQIPFIFERFRQVDGSLTRNYRGIGLGLAITKELLDEHNGSIKVSSRKGLGTTFTIKIPLYKGKSKPFESSLSKYNIFTDTFRKADFSKIHIPHHIEEMALSTENKKYKIMIIDDEPDMCKFLVSIFAEEYITIQAHDGIAGIEKALKEKPDVIIIDIMIPGMDGIKICRRLSNYAELEYTKIILLTARTDECIKIEGLKSGADDFITKPFSTTEVITRVENILRTSIQQRQINEAMDRLKEIEARLIQSEKLNSLGILSAGIIHEINNPLNFMSGYIGGLRKKKKDSDPEIKEAIDNIYDGIERIANITSNLKKFTSGAKRYEQCFSINESLQSALTLAGAKIKGIKIANEIYKEECEVIGLPDEVSQVFINLFINAADALNDIDREPEIKISSYKKGGRLFIKFEDNGCGIDNSKLSNIFDPFFTTKEPGEGMGLGLSICYNIIQNHGGTLNVNSKSGEFTEFIFDLPTIEDKESRGCMI